eukprot:3332850-Rhodomonas_salina.3
MPRCASSPHSPSTLASACTPLASSALPASSRCVRLRAHPATSSTAHGPISFPLKSTKASRLGCGAR